MKDTISTLIQQAIDTLTRQGTLPEGLTPSVQVERTRDKSHGDFASNIALMLAKPAGQKPRDVATALQAALPVHPAISKTDIAGPGFINFFVAEDFVGNQLKAALADPHLGSHCPPPPPKPRARPRSRQRRLRVRRRLYRRRRR